MSANNDLQKTNRFSKKKNSKPKHTLKWGKTEDFTTEIQRAYFEMFVTEFKKSNLREI